MNMVTVTHPKTGEKFQLTEQEALARGAKPSEGYAVKKAMKQQGELDPMVENISQQPWVRSIAEGLHKVKGAPEALHTVTENPLFQGMESASRGALQAGGDTFASLANLINKPINAVLGTNYKQEHPDFKKGIPYSLPNELAFLGGEIGTAFAGSGFGGTPGALQALQKIPRPQGWLGLAGDAASGAGLGYALGENAEGDRTLGTILGGILGPISSISGRGITERILKDKGRQLERHNAAYNDVFEAADNANVIFQPKHLNEMGYENLLKDFKRLTQKLPTDYRDAVFNFLNDTTTRNAHKLQSELGDFVRKMESSEAFKTKTLPGGKEATRAAASRIRDALKKDIPHTLAQGGLIGESIAYPAITQSYARNVVPYLNESISDAALKNIFPKQLPAILAKDAQFMNKQKMSKLYPEIKLNQLVDSPRLKKGLALVAALLGINTATRAEEKEPYIETPNYKVYD